MRRTMAFISIGLLMVTHSATWGAETNVAEWETQGEQQGTVEWIPETSDWNASEGDESIWPESSDYIGENIIEESTEAAPQEYRPLGWNVTIEMLAGEQQGRLTVEGGYYSDNAKWFSVYGVIPVQQDDGTIIEKEISASPALVIDQMGTCYFDAMAVAWVFDQLAGAGETLYDLASIWTQNSWVTFEEPRTEEGEGLWDGILTSLQAWRAEGESSTDLTDVKGAFPKWWADQMIDSISGFLDICEPTGLYGLYQTVMQVPYSETEWGQLITENPTASGLLHSWWATVNDESYEAYKDSLFGKDEKGLSSQLIVNTENESNGYAIYIRKLFDQELAHIQVNWDTAVDNMRDEQAPIPWTISVDALKENYLVLMGNEASDESTDQAPETVWEESQSAEEWQPAEEGQQDGGQPVEAEQPVEENQWNQEVPETEAVWGETNAQE